MSGFNIIKITEVTRGSLLVLIPLLIGAGMIIFGLFFYYTRNIIYKRLKNYGIILIILSFVLAFFIRIPTGEYYYKVKFTDDVSINEIYENYEIISYDDGIFTIRK